MIIVLKKTLPDLSGPDIWNPCVIKKTKRLLYNLLGAVFFITGFIGIFLPVLPTTIFMILALWAFSNGSERFHQWLYHHPTFGPPLQAWEKRGVIPLRGKVMAVVVMSLSALYLVFLSAAPVWAVACAIATMIAVSVYILTRPSA